MEDSVVREELSSKSVPVLSRLKSVEDGRVGVLAKVKEGDGDISRSART